MHHPVVFSDQAPLHHYLEARGGLVIVWEGPQLWRLWRSRLTPEQFKACVTMVSCMPCGVQWALLVPQALVRAKRGS